MSVDEHLVDIYLSVNVHVHIVGEQAFTIANNLPGFLSFIIGITCELLSVESLISIFTTSAASGREDPGAGTH